MQGSMPVATYLRVRGLGAAAPSDPDPEVVAALSEVASELSACREALLESELCFDGTLDARLDSANERLCELVEKLC